MPVELEIRYHQMEPSDALNALIANELEALAAQAELRFCRVTVEWPHRHSRAKHFHIHLALGLRHGRVDLTHAEPEGESAQEAVIAAFHAARRRLASEHHHRNFRRGRAVLASPA